jgi:hypothetical protein
MSAAAVLRLTGQVVTANAGAVTVTANPVMETMFTSLFVMVGRENAEVGALRLSLLMALRAIKQFAMKNATPPSKLMFFLKPTIKT